MDVELNEDPAAGSVKSMVLLCRLDPGPDAGGVKVMDADWDEVRSTLVCERSGYDRPDFVTPSCEESGSVPVNWGLNGDDEPEEEIGYMLYVPLMVPLVERTRVL